MGGTRGNPHKPLEPSREVVHNGRGGQGEGEKIVGYVGQPILFLPTMIVDDH